MRKNWIKILLMLFMPAFGWTQDKVVTITPAMFDKTNDEVALSSADGWLFKQGNDTAWAKKVINTNGWKKIKPSDFSEKYADKNGKVEGWFRLRIKPDKTLATQKLGLRWVSAAAADVFIDGVWFRSFGNTGENGKPYSENEIFPNYGPKNIEIKTGAEHTIVVHFVDYLSPFPPRELKSQGDAMLSLTGQACATLLTIYKSKMLVYVTIWVSVCALLSLLFWLLSLNNPAERQLRLISVCSTFFALLTYFSMRIRLTDLSFSGYILNSYGLYFMVELILITMPIILADIFKRKISQRFKMLAVVLVIYSAISYFLPSYLSIPLGAANLFLVIICIYYIVSSWRKLRGAQWCIVAGLLSSALFITSLQVWGVVNKGDYASDIIFYLRTGFLLSFPISLLVYVAMRFKEIIKEVRQNAERVVQMSEEKKQEALSRQKVLEEEVRRQTTEIRNTLDNLKATQTQLIQSEKMASLGELTAGIAHEIQNPLNFVNNFSDVSAELVEEMDGELDKGDIPQAKAIGADLKQNLEKIRHHGKRADAIVKGMLQHSNAGSGKKEPTNINALGDECMRLAYHGLRAKDKSFNAELVSRFDEMLPKVNVIPQDLVRVMLNLFNNAFYAVNQKSKTAGADYKPEVSVSTSTSNRQVIIKVKDNGVGIPDTVKEKIMQPFFTTKPTGEGTGLGLSLSYDMVVKGHGGNITVNTKEGEFAEFIVCLPI